jgi:hypothetical protein
MSSWWSRNRRLILQLAGTVLAILLLVLLVREEQDEGKAIIAAMREIKVTDLLWVALLFSISAPVTGGCPSNIWRIGRFGLAAPPSWVCLYNFLPDNWRRCSAPGGVMRMGFMRRLRIHPGDRLIGMAACAYSHQLYIRGIFYLMF